MLKAEKKDVERYKEHVYADLVQHGPMRLPKLLGRYNRMKGAAVEEAVKALRSEGKVVGEALHVEGRKRKGAKPLEVLVAVLPKSE